MFENKEDGSKYLQLYNYYKNLIISGVLSSGDKMPSIRKCAQSFEISRTTVETAYDMLAAEGYIISKAQSGFYVCGTQYYAVPETAGSENRTEDKEKIKYDLVSATADKAGFNFALWRRYVKSALRQDDRLLYYGEVQGEQDLREAISAYISKERGVVCSAAQIVIAAGTQNLLNILCALTKERKDVAFVGSDFRQGMAVFEDYGKNIIAKMPMPEEIKELEFLSSCIFYTSASHTDNWGGVLSSRQRMQLLSLARKNDWLIIEDDYDSEFRYNNRQVTSLQGMNGGQDVVYIGTFSKLLLPSIRISFMVLPLRMAAAYRKRAQLYNQTASKAEQIALCQYIRDGHLLSVIRKQKKLFAAKTKTVCEQGAKILPPEVRLEECPTSYLIRVTVSGQGTAQEIAQRCSKYGILIKPVSDENGKAYLLISVAGFDAENTQDMLCLLAKAIGN